MPISGQSNPTRAARFCQQTGQHVGGIAIREGHETVHVRDSLHLEELEQRYAKISIRDFDGNPQLLSEMDALVAYLQMLGTLVDLKAYQQNENLR